MTDQKKLEEARVMHRQIGEAVERDEYDPSGWEVEFLDDIQERRLDQDIPPSNSQFDKLQEIHTRAVK